MVKIYTLDTSTANKRSTIFLNTKRGLSLKATVAVIGSLLVLAAVAVLTMGIDEPVAPRNGNGAPAPVATPSSAHLPASNPQASFVASISTSTAPTDAQADPQYFRASSADDLYARVSIAMGCADQDATWVDSETCQGIPPKNARELRQLLSDAANAGAPAAQRYLAQEEADRSAKALDDAEMDDPSLRAQGVERLQASVDALQKLALQSGDARQLAQVSAIYSRNTGNLADGARYGAAWAMVAGLRAGQKPSELASLTEAFSDDEAAQVRKLVDQLSMRLPPASAPVTEADAAP